MSSTRHAPPGSPFRPERYASSAEYEKGLPALEVARRCEKLATDEERELVWRIQHRSWNGGLRGLIREILDTCSDRIGTRTMRLNGGPRGCDFNAEEMKAISEELDPRDYDPILEQFLPAREEAAEAKVSELVDYCRIRAKMDLETWLRDFCVNPARTFAARGPAYFVEFLDCLRAWAERERQRAAEGRFITSFGRRIREALDYASVCPSLLGGAVPLTLIYGNSGFGKSTETKAAAAERPGLFRHVEIPSGNDDHGFFLALAVGLGVSNGIRCKVQELKERVERVLMLWHGVLILDEAHRLWPQSNLRDNTPKRVEWVNSMSEKGVRICLVAGPQYFDSQGLAEDRVRWNTLQQERRIGLMISPKGPPTPEDISGVVRRVLPEADDKDIRHVCTAAKHSSSPFSTVSMIWSHATARARSAARTTPCSADIAGAILQAIETNTALANAIKERKGGRKDRVDPTLLPPDGAPASRPNGEADAPSPQITREAFRMTPQRTSSAGEPTGVAGQARQPEPAEA